MEVKVVKLVLSSFMYSIKGKTVIFLQSELHENYVGIPNDIEFARNNHFYFQYIPYGQQRHGLDTKKIKCIS